MSSVDSRIVTMKFDNAQFESGARTSLSTLDKLKASLNFGSVGNAATKTLSGISGIFAKFGIKNPFSTAEKGAADLNAATQSVATSGMPVLDGAVTGISKSFLAMSTIAITALTNITNKAINAASQMGKSLTVSPVMEGFSEYELKMDSIQTMLANTARYNTKLPEVMKNLNELNDYADKTIYNFGDMTKNIGLFTNAGIRIGDATSMIKGFSNSAAASGTSAQGAAGAAYQLSQALSAGTIRLMDWRSLTNVGMGNKNMQQGIVDIADAMGVLDKAGTNSKEVMNDFNGSLEKKWLSADVMSKYLKIMAGDMDEAKMKTIGLTDAQIQNFNKQQKTAEDAATKVRTYTKLVGTLQEAVGSSWAETAEIVVGDFNEATKLWTHVNDTLGGMLGKMGERRNEMLKEWDELGGRKVIIDGLIFAFDTLRGVLGPISAAFRDVFPRTTGERLFEMTLAFTTFMQKLKPGSETVHNLFRTFKGLFSILDIVGMIIGAVAGQVGRFFGAVGEGSGSFLEFTAGIGDTIVAFRDFMEESGVLETFFRTLGDILAVPLRLLASLGGVLGALFEGFDSGKVGEVSGAVDSLSASGERLSSVGDKIMSIFESLGDVLGRVGDVVVDALSGIGDAISNALTPETFSKSLDVINTGLLGAIVLMIKRFFAGGLNIEVGGGGFFDSIKDTLGAATDALQNMQANLKANVLLKIAGALGILALSLALLAGIDSADLTKALLAMGGGFLAMQFAMVSLNTAIGVIGAAKLPFIAAAMMGLATALLILAGAMKILGGMDLYEIARGLVAIGGVLFVIQKAMGPMSKNAGGMIRAAGAILILGVALNVLAGAMKVFATMSWGEMIKGLAGVAGGLTAIAVGMRLMPKGILLQAAAILVLSVAMNAMGAALKLFATMSWAEMGKGIATLAAALVTIGIAMRLMPKGMTLQAAALVLVSVALNAIGGALKLMGGMSWTDIAQGLVALGGALLILAVGLNAMGPVALVGAAALTVATAALILLTPVLITLGSLKWETIIKSLTTLAGVFVILGLAGFILAPLTPVLIGLGAALVLIGAGLALAGVGAMGFATAFGVIVATGTSGVKILVGILGALVAAIPKAMVAMAKGFIGFLVTIAQSGPKFTKAMAQIISNMLDAVIKNVPKMGKAFMVMLNTALKIIVTMSPKIFAAGLRLIIGFLSAIEKNIGKIVNLSTRIIVNFINGIARNIGRIIQSGVNLIIKFIEGVTKAINNNSERIGRAGADLAIAMVNGMANGIRGAAGRIGDAAMDAARAAWEEVKDFFKVGSPSKLMRDDLGRWLPIGMALGIRDEADQPAQQIKRMGKSTMDTLRSTMGDISDGFAMETDLNPTVTPVLDLTKLTQEANRMTGILAVSPIDASVSYGQASAISMETQAAQEAAWEAAAGGVETREIKLEQNNYSPKPIDPITTYRNTKSLLSLAKEALES